MWPEFQALLAVISTVARSRFSLQLEVVALRHQLSVYRRSVKRPKIRPGDRILWSWLSRLWPGWREVLAFVQPGTVLSWQRRRFREHWARLSPYGPPGRPTVSKEVQDLIRRISRANPDWGSPRIVGELGKLGIAVAKSTVEKYRIRSSKPPSSTWRAFLKNHVADLVSIDFFTIPTIRFKILFVLVVLLHHRRKVVYFNVTENPTAQWAAQQNRRSLPLGARSEISASGSRCDIWRSISPAGRESGHRTSSHRSAESLAKFLRRTFDRNATTGVL